MSGGRPIAWSITGGARPPAAPDGTPLVLEISCPSGVDGRHEVTVAPDWRMEVPHDLTSERVLAAFGGSSPCLKLEQAVKASRLWLEMELRHSIPRLKPNGEAAKPAVTAACCPRATPLFQATAHVRSIEHLANVYDVPKTQLREVVDSVSAAYGIRHGNSPHPGEIRTAQYC